MARRIRLVAATFFASALVLAWVALVHADGYGFSPPNGWRATHPPAGYAGLWVNPAGQEAVNLATASVSSLSSLVSRQLQKSGTLYPSMHLYSNVPYHVCGHHDARYLIWTSSNRGSHWIHEQVMADWGDSGYVASYVRPASFAPNRDARAAIVSICGVTGAGINNPSSGSQPAPQSQPAAETPAQPAPAQPTPYVYPSLTPRYAPVIPM